MRAQQLVALVVPPFGEEVKRLRRGGGQVGVWVVNGRAINAEPPGAGRLGAEF